MHIIVYPNEKSLDIIFCFFDYFNRSGIFYQNDTAGIYGCGFGTVEAVKTVSDLFLPVAGTISEKNPLLDSQPELVNQDPYGDGWMVKMTLSDPSQIDGLMDAAAYKALIGA